MITKISFITTQSIINIIKLTPSFSDIKSLSNCNIIKKNYQKNKDHIYCNDNKIKQNLNKQFCNQNEDQECDWGWFVEIDDIYTR